MEKRKKQKKLVCSLTKDGVSKVLIRRPGFSNKEVKSLSVGPRGDIALRPEISILSN